MIAAGTELPELAVDVTPTFVISTALATRDFQDVHHDRDAAQARGSADIFLNILTDTGLVQRFVTDWAGPDALVRSIEIKLGVPCYAGDTLVELDGSLPLNPHGGQLGEAYVHGMNGIAEGVRQIRGESCNPVSSVSHVLVTAGTGVPTSGLVLAQS